jgi:hypothetical protein
LNKAFDVVSQVQGARVDSEGAFKPQALDGSNAFDSRNMYMYKPSGKRIELTYHEE